MLNIHVTGQDGTNLIVPFKSFVFNGGETQVKIDVVPIAPGSPVVIKAKIMSANDVMELLVLTDAIKRNYKASIHLEMPYLPYARQDRVCDTGEALSLKVFCDLINAQNYASVTIWDVHSDVSLALLDRVIHVQQWQLVKATFADGLPSDTIIVAPDAGASKKTYEVAVRMNLRMIQATKHRDVTTGKITETKIVDFNGLESTDKYLIVDDICDGGRTFIELAKVLKSFAPKSEVHLFVTHGIFSQGLDVFEGLIDHIYCPNVFHPELFEQTKLQTMVN
jgi:ribose-phosphate pyrophosphokinase